MEKVNTGRRRLLQVTSLWVGGATALAFAPAADAWDAVPLDPGSPAGMAYTNRCGGAQEQAAIVRKLKLALAGDQGAPSLSAACPICGCPVTVER